MKNERSPPEKVMAIKIREMDISDYAVCQPLWRDAGMHHEPDFHNRLATLLTQNPGLSLVALEENEICGCILGSYNGFSGYVFRLVVDPKVRGAGIGKQLSLECERKLIRAGAAKVMLACETELESFYESLGYTRTSARFMMKKLVENDPI